MAECERCGSKENLVHHHVSYEPEVIQILCLTCHGRVHSFGGIPKRPIGFQSNLPLCNKLASSRDPKNIAIEVLDIIYKTPRITPVMIHDRLEKAMNYNFLEYALRILRETGEINTLCRGVYMITEKGVKTITDSRNV